ncbi:protein takeout-like [Tribolium madens]|uniref:protein takeout-like n=1 Tax=Tribolium madens TaxID=41895 RepID=UPI001CF72E97|nr:protein takeout-like [Tribolium madens]
MKCVFFGLYFLFCASFCSCTKLPSSFLKCDKNQTNFQKCLIKAVTNALAQLNKPFKEVGLPNMEPLEVPSLTIGAGSGAVSFQQNYKNLKMSGFTQTTCPKFDVIFPESKISMSCASPAITMDFDYDINGRILLLPIFGDGPGSIILDHIGVDIIFHFEEYEKKNKKYYKIKSTELSMTPNLIKFDLKNLFHGDKALGDNILKVMNENWEEVFRDVKSGYEKAFAQIFTSIFNRLLERISVNELFGGE